MKLTSRGFTLVELMIVIAIIGILAAALFPSMTNYLKRSRDAARTSHLKDISTAIGAYYADRETYPDHDLGCVNSGALTTNYLAKGLPIDPTSGKDNGCNEQGIDGYYGYGSGVVSSTQRFLVTAILENTNGWNTGSIIGYTGANVTVIPGTWQKGVGAGYVLVN